MRYRKSVLVVDDDEQVLDVLRQGLSGGGYRVDAAGSAEQALSAMRERRYDLMLTDINMPGMSGIELLRQARQMNPGMPSIVLSACGEVNIAVDAAQAGAAHYLTKPFDLDEIRDRIDQLLQESHVDSAERTDGPAILRTRLDPRLAALMWRIFLLGAMVTLFATHGPNSMSVAGICTVLGIYGAVAIAYSCLPRPLFLALTRSGHGFLPDYFFLAACLLASVGGPAEMAVLFAIGVTIGLTTRDLEGLLMYLPLTWLFTVAAVFTVGGITAIFTATTPVLILGLALVAGFSFACPHLHGALARRRGAGPRKRVSSPALNKATRHYRQSEQSLIEAVCHPGADARPVTRKVMNAIQHELVDRITKAESALIGAFESAAERADAVAHGMRIRTVRAAQKLHADIGSTELRPLVDAVVRRFSEEARARGIDLRIEGIPERATVETDAALLSELLSELVDNAIIYGKQRGTVTIRVDGSLTRDRRGLNLVIEDDGRGIPREEIDKVFQWCTRVEGSTSCHPLGLGIGLYLARRIADCLGVDLAITAGSGDVQTLVRLVIPSSFRAPGERRASQSLSALQGG